MAHDLSYLQFSILIRAAKLYFNAKEAASQLELSQESYTSLVEIRNLVRERYEKGLRSSLDFRLAETSVATSIVSIENRVTNKRYGKIVASTKRYKVHDDSNECGVGDIVLISETRPLSKTKRWELKEVKQKSLKLAKQVTGE